MYAPDAGVVYPTLQMLEEMGLITAAQAEGKRVYLSPTPDVDSW
jgi:DNA-binding PadR family transcriptional regulator